MTQKNLPRSAFQFLASADISAPETASAERTLTGVAYSGGLVTDHGYWNALVIDLASLSVDTPIPLLMGHDHEETIGMVTSATTQAGNLGIEARLFADVDDDAAEIAAKADKGFPWQLSVGIWPNSIEEVPTGNSISLNGQTFTGPLTVFRGGRVREVSVVAIGADSRTSATVLSGAHEFQIPFTTHEDPAMSKELEAKVAALEVENAQLKAQNTELSAKAPDPAQFVPVDAMAAMQTELAAMKAKDQEREVNDLIQPALLAGKLLPAQEAWAHELGKANLSALKTFIDTAQPVAALAGTQTGGQGPDAGRSLPNDAVNLAAKASQYQAQQAALGISVDDITAINHVSQAHV